MKGLFSGNTIVQLKEIGHWALNHVTETVKRSGNLTPRLQKSWAAYFPKIFPFASVKKKPLSNFLDSVTLKAISENNNRLSN